jgi:hypothetical protein
MPYSSNSIFLPDSIIIGMQKCATTSIYDMLKKNPAFSLTFPKETHFFSVEFHHGFSWYRNKFSNSNPCAHFIDICPSYLCSLHALSRISHYSQLTSFVPDIYVISRNEASRVASLLLYRSLRHQIKQPNLASLVNSSHASEILARDMIDLWKKYFPCLSEISLEQLTCTSQVSKSSNSSFLDSYLFSCSKDIPRSNQKPDTPLNYLKNLIMKLPFVVVIYRSFVRSAFAALVVKNFRNFQERNLLGR